MAIQTAASVGSLADRITEVLFTERGRESRVASRLELKFGRCGSEVAGGGWSKEGASLAIYEILLDHTHPCIIP